MSVPKKRQTPSARNSRRSHHALSAKGVSSCPKCAKPMIGHRACPSCGTYKGKTTLLSKRVDKKAKRAREKAL